MNLAFNSILIILLILPGFIFSLALYNSDEPFYYPPLTHRTIISLFASIFFLQGTLLVFKHFFDQINLDTILELVAGKNNDQYLQLITSKDLLYFGSYIIIMYVISYLIGLLIKNCFVKKFKLDAKFKLLGLESPWYYLLNGYDWEVGEPDLIIITAAVEFAGKGYLFNGFLEDYYLDKNGELDRLILTDTRRRTIENDHHEEHGIKTKKSVDDRFYPIDGHNFVLKYSNIKSLNIQFLKIDPIN